jgi:hypothetical protein
MFRLHTFPVDPHSIQRSDQNDIDALHAAHVAQAALRDLSAGWKKLRMDAEAAEDAIQVVGLAISHLGQV